MFNFIFEYGYQIYHIHKPPNSQTLKQEKLIPSNIPQQMNRLCIPSALSPRRLLPSLSSSPSPSMPKSLSQIMCQFSQYPDAEYILSYAPPQQNHNPLDQWISQQTSNKENYNHNVPRNCYVGKLGALQSPRTSQNVRQIFREQAKRSKGDSPLYKLISKETQFEVDQGASQSASNDPQFLEANTKKCKQTNQQHTRPSPIQQNAENMTKPMADIPAPSATQSPVSYSFSTEYQSPNPLPAPKNITLPNIQEIVSEGAVSQIYTPQNGNRDDGNEVSLLAVGKDTVMSICEEQRVNMSIERHQAQAKSNIGRANMQKVMPHHDYVAPASQVKIEFKKIVYGNREKLGDSKGQVSEPVKKEQRKFPAENAMLKNSKQLSVKSSQPFQFDLDF